MPKATGRRRARSGGPADDKGIRRTKTGWRRILPGAADDEDDEPKKGSKGQGPMTGDRYRGRTTRQRNVADKVAREWAERRAAAELTEKELDLERASVDAEVELLDPAARHGGRRRVGRRDGRPAEASRPSRRTVPGHRPVAPAAASRTSRSCRGCSTTPAPSAASASASATAGDGPGQHGKHVGLTSVPHGAKSYLAAALALAPDAERICWVARDAEIGDRVAEELGAWLGDPDLVAILEPRTSLAYERSELVPDETAARVAALAAWRAGQAQGARRERPGARPGDARAGRPARARSAPCAPGTRIGHGPAPRRAPRARLHAR